MGASRQEGVAGGSGALGAAASLAAEAGAGAGAGAPTRFPVKRPLDPLLLQRRIGGSGASQVVKAPSAGTAGVTCKVVRGGAGGGSSEGGSKGGSGMH